VIRSPPRFYPHYPHLVGDGIHVLSRADRPENKAKRMNPVYNVSDNVAENKKATWVRVSFTAYHSSGRDDGSKTNRDGDYYIGNCSDRLRNIRPACGFGYRLCGGGLSPHAGLELDS
jgi:hypothetical protein